MKKKPKSLQSDSINAIDTALAFIASAQCPGGYFASRTFVGQIPDHTAKERLTTFHTSLILDCLSHLRSTPQARLIGARGVAYLLKERSPEWTFNYWKKGSPEFATIHVPDDIDDTSAALTAINAWQPERIDASALVHIVNAFIVAETAPGGPYNTWIMSEYDGTDWKDIDIAVNSNAAHFLARKDIVLAPLNEYIEHAISANNLTSQYYAPHMIRYLIAKWYRGNAVPKLLLTVEQDMRKKNRTALECATTLTAFLRLGGDPKRVHVQIARLIESQSADGSWPASECYIEQIQNGIPWKSGSKALTTAFCLEAFAVYDQMLIAWENKKTVGIHANAALRIIALTTKRFALRSPLLQSQFTFLASEVTKKDSKHEIALFPYFFNASLAKNMHASKRTVDQLCMINMLGWIGYTISDKVLDGEAMERFLPIADICIREVSIGYRSLIKNDHDYRCIENILDMIGEATAWEHSTCKLRIDGSQLYMPQSYPEYKNYRQLAEKSLGHALGPVTIMLLSKNRSKRLHAQTLLQFFEHYLIARQLNDDAHDWLDDLKSGFINSASVEVLKKCVPPGGSINLEHDTPLLQDAFWHGAIDHIAGAILSHTKKARAVLKTTHFIKDTRCMEELLIPLENSARAALRERDAAIEFIAAYDATATGNEAAIQA